MNKPEMVILIGNIGSGKSTYAKKYQKKGYIVIARDYLRYAIGGGEYIFNPDYEPIIWKTEMDILRRFMGLGVNIIVDEVGISKSMRKRYIDETKRLGYKVIVIEMPHFNMGESITRRMIKNHGNQSADVWKQIWTKFEAQYESPLLTEGIDKIIKVKKEEVS